MSLGTLVQSKIIQFNCYAIHSYIYKTYTFLFLADIVEKVIILVAFYYRRSHSGYCCAALHYIHQCS